MIRVAKQTVGQPATHSPILVHSKRSGSARVKPVQLDVTHAQMMATRRVADVTPGQPYYILLSNLSWKQILVSKHKTVVHAMVPPNTNAATEIRLIDREKKQQYLLTV